MLRSRREFLRRGSAACAAGVLWPRHLWVDLASVGTPPGAWDAAVRALVAPEALAARAIEAAKSAGATYADVNIFITQTEGWGLYRMDSWENLVGMGVRALVNGYWGFGGFDGLPTADQAATLGRQATAQAQSAAQDSPPRTVDLGTIPVATGSWTMPIEIDPFTVSLQEKEDFTHAIQDFIVRQHVDVGGLDGFFVSSKESRWFASTEGAATDQTIFTMRGSLYLGYKNGSKPTAGGAVYDLGLAGAGWEYIRNFPFRDQAAAMIELARIPRAPRPVDLGRYDLVLDSRAMAYMIGASIAAATPLDRAMGYLANSVGTSYLNQPLAMLGTYPVGSPLLTVSTNRSMPGGAATVQWDNEGVVPREATLVREGILTDYQTTRESASWLAPYYQKIGRPVQSNGCAGTDGLASAEIAQVKPNVVMHPGAHAASFDDLIKDTKRGLAVLGGYSRADQQALNGVGDVDNHWHMREIRNGVLGDFIRETAQYLYRSPEFWTHLVAVGGPATAQSHGIGMGRRERGYTISTVPGKVTNVAVNDVFALKRGQG